MKLIFLIVILFLRFTPVYAVKAGPFQSYSFSQVNKISIKPGFFLNNAANVCCKPDGDYPFDKDHFLLVLAGCGIGVLD
jgi:hypothetical protein